MSHYGKLCITATIFLSFACGLAMGETKDKAAVGRLDSAAAMRYRNRNRYVLQITTANGRRLLIGVENNKDDDYKLDPKSDLLDQIKAVAPGDMVKIEYTDQGDGTNMMKSLKAYPMLPGQELPNAYLFKESYDHTEGTKTESLVDLKQFDDVVTFSLLNKKDASGTLAADPQLLADLGKLREGQVVLVEATTGSLHPILRSIELYNPPQTGTFKGIKPAELDGNKTTEADIDVDGSPVAVLVPGHLDGKRWIVDSKILSKVRGLRPGANVSFRIVTDNGNSLLRDIKIAPKANPKDAAR